MNTPLDGIRKYGGEEAGKINQPKDEYGFIWGIENYRDIKRLVIKQVKPDRAGHQRVMYPYLFWQEDFTTNPFAWTKIMKGTVHRFYNIQSHHDLFFDTFH